MAKALLGHLGGPDPVVLAEIARLRMRVRDLESEVDRLRTANDALTILVAEEPHALRRGTGAGSDLTRLIAERGSCCRQARARFQPARLADGRPSGARRSCAGAGLVEPGALEGDR